MHKVRHTETDVQLLNVLKWFNMLISAWFDGLALQILQG